jgi:hypothetical protein
MLQATFVTLLLVGGQTPAPPVPEQWSPNPLYEDGAIVVDEAHGQSGCRNCQAAGDGYQYQGLLRSTPGKTHPRTAFMYRYTEWYGIHYTRPRDFRRQLDYPWGAPFSHSRMVGHGPLIDHGPHPVLMAPPDAVPDAIHDPHSVEEIGPPTPPAPPYPDVDALPPPTARAPRRLLLR